MNERTPAPGAPVRERDADLRVADVGPFLLFTFALTWGLVWLMISWPERMEAVFGEMGVTSPGYLLAVWSPALVAFGLILYRSGRARLWRFLSRLSPRGVTPAWWAVALLALPLVKIAGAVLNGAPWGELLVVSPLREVLMISLFMLFLGPVEELGWRGALLPLVQRRIAPVWAGILVGFVWAVWHIPAFFLDGAPHTAWSLLPFLVGVTAVGVVMAVVYNRTGGNLFLAVVIHWQLNIALWPEAQPWENYLMVLLAVVLVWANRDVMLSTARAETIVVPQ